MLTLLVPKLCRAPWALLPAALNRWHWLKLVLQLSLEALPRAGGPREVL